MYIFKFLGRMLAWIVGVIAVLVLALVIFMALAPQVGQKPKGEILDRISSSSHYQGGEFKNLIPTGLGSMTSMLKLLPEYFKDREYSPKEELHTDFGRSNV